MSSQNHPLAGLGPMQRCMLREMYLRGIPYLPSQTSWKPGGSSLNHTLSVLSSLQRRGLVMCNEDTGHYRLTPKGQTVIVQMYPHLAEGGDFENEEEG